MSGPPLTRRKFLAAGVAAGVGSAGVGKGFYNTSKIELEKVPVVIDGLPSAFKGYKIAILSDLHSSSIVPQSLIKNGADIAMSQKPDMIALLGDYISASMFGVNQDDIDSLTEALSGLAAPDGIYGVFGNHENFMGDEAYAAIGETLGKRIGVRWLRNDHAVIERGGEAVEILGTDDYWAKTCYFSRAYLGTEPGRVKILLSHNPDITTRADIVGKKVDLVLCGHTHGGQIVLPIVGPLAIPTQKGRSHAEGLKQDESGRQVYVTRGVGHVLLPVRYNCPPEVTIITLV